MAATHITTEARALKRYVCFSNRPVRVKRFQAIHDSDGDVARGLSVILDCDRQ
jgi:hypothetical protein